MVDINISVSKIKKENHKIGFLPSNVQLFQYNISDCIISIFRNTDDNTIEKKIIYYFCGYNDYFFHYHMLKDGFDIIVIDIKGFGYNKSYNSNQPYSEGKYFNYYDNIDYIVKNLDNVFSSLGSIDEYRNDYKKHFIYGHSTGGHIVLSYISESKINPIKFDCIVLNSPLTQIYLPSIEVPIIKIKFNPSKIINYLSKIVGFFTKNIDFRAVFMGKKTDHSSYINTINGCIKSIQNNGNSIDPRFKSNIGQPILIDWINFVHSQIAKMKSSKNKINIQTIMICSKSFGNITYTDYNYDDILNPDICEQDIKEIIKHDKLSIYRKNTGHDIILEPSNDNDNNTDDNWENYFKLMFLE